MLHTLLPFLQASKAWHGWRRTCAAMPWRASSFLVRLGDGCLRWTITELWMWPGKAETFDASYCAIPPCRHLLHVQLPGGSCSDVQAGGREGALRIAGLGRC